MVFLLIILSFPSTFGGKGIYRTKCADIEWLVDERAMLIMNADGEGYRYDYSDTVIDYGSGRIGIAYVPKRRVELYSIWRIHGIGRARNPLNESDFEGDMGDTDIGIKNLLLSRGGFYFAGDLSLTLPIGRDPYSNDQFIAYPKVLGTYDFGRRWNLLPVRGHLNLGVPLGRKGLSSEFPVTFAFAAELPSKFFTYFMELSRNHERDWHWRVTPGLKFHPFHRLSLTLGADLGLVTDFRLLGMNLGLSFNSSLTREREIMPTGMVAGEIRDGNTNAPVLAKATIVELDEEATSTKDYGVYRFYGLPKGVYTIKVEAQNYAPESRAVVVESQKAALSNFRLDRVSVTYAGLVLDQKSGIPAADARVDVTGATRYAATVNPDGYFELTLKPGSYEVKVNKNNYVQLSSKISIADDQFDTLRLRPIELLGETPEAVVYFDIDNANIRDDQKPDLDRIAEFLKGHPEVKAELRGHTDLSGSIEYNEILSLARANSVLDYLVKLHGVEKERIAVMAFSKTKPVKEKADLSRRVEIYLVK